MMGNSRIEGCEQELMGWCQDHEIASGCETSAGADQFGGVLGDVLGDPEVKDRVGTRGGIGK
jgi:hypothetical protein